MIFGLLFCVCIYYFLLKPMVINSLLLDNNNALVKGKIFKIENVAEGGPVYFFNYYIHNKKYIGEVASDTRFPVNIGDCFWVKYYPPDPSIYSVRIEVPETCDTPESKIKP